MKEIIVEQKKFFGRPEYYPQFGFKEAFFRNQIPFVGVAIPNLCGLETEYVFDIKAVKC